MNALLNNVPLFSYFNDICHIPHGSGNTEKISEYCLDFAEKNGLEAFRDNFNNVIIKKNATLGFENKNPVILQAHLDMVCVKTKQSKKDFIKEGIETVARGDYLYAKDTSLGADDGIGVALILSILADKKISHPPIEAVFTTDEEVGMDGAFALDCSLLNGKTLINIDSEEEGIFTVSCAGGARVDISLETDSEKIDKPCFKIELGGLLGGHSGTEINKKIYNANVLLGKFLNGIDENFNIIDIKGGEKDNAIAKESECKISTCFDLKQYAEQFLFKYRNDENKDLKIVISDCQKSDYGLSLSSSKRIAEFLSGAPNGVISFCENMEDLVETSLNLGVIKSENNNFYAHFSVRSCVESKKEMLISSLTAYAEKFSGKAKRGSEYPAWEFKENSKLQDVMKKVYKSLYGKNAQISAIHAGLECGVFVEKINGIDAVSIGPDIFGAHTPFEKVSISSVNRTYDFLINVLKELK